MKLTICLVFFLHFNISGKTFKIRLRVGEKNLHSFNDLI